MSPIVILFLNCGLYNNMRGERRWILGEKERNFLGTVQSAKERTKQFFY